MPLDSFTTSASKRATRSIFGGLQLRRLVVDAQNQVTICHVSRDGL